MSTIVAETAGIHVIAGLTGAGKTTYAEALRRELRGVRFSVDDWNARLFFPDRPPDAGFDWFNDRVQRVCAQIRDTADQVLAAGAPAVLDCGFTDLRQRREFYDWADALGRPVSLHVLDIDPATRWDRVRRRNADQGATFALEVTREMFDFMESIWEAPDAAEMAARDGRVIRGRSRVRG